MNTKVLIACGSVLGLAVGGVAGYLLAKKRLEAKYAELAKTEIDEARNYYKILYKGDELSTPEGALQTRVPGETLSDADRADTKVHEGPGVDVLEKVVKGLRYGDSTMTRNVNVFEERDKEWPNDWAEEDSKRTPDVPYILDLDEYMQGERNYTQISLTYYAKDDILADDEDDPIQDVEATVGNDNLDKFGHRSGDPRVVYIRNERLEADFEICKHSGSYAEIVHGIHEVKHSSVRRFRKE